MPSLVGSEMCIRDRNQNLPLDTIEALAWGSNLDWGFSKHPPVSAFFPELFFRIFGAQDLSLIHI